MVISPNCVSFDGLKKVSTHSRHLSDVWGQNGKMVPVSPKGVSKSCFKLMILFDARRTVQQLRPCRVLEAILIPAEGFPSRQNRPKKEL